MERPNLYLIYLLNNVIYLCTTTKIRVSADFIRAQHLLFDLKTIFLTFFSMTDPHFSGDSISDGFLHVRYASVKLLLALRPLAVPSCYYHPPYSNSQLPSLHVLNGFHTLWPQNCTTNSLFLITCSDVERMSCRKLRYLLSSGMWHRGKSLPNL